MHKAGNDFMPNPPIQVEDNISPDHTPPKKTWERHYKTFLTRRGNHNKNSDGSSPKSPKPASSSPKNMASSQPDSRKSGFSLVPGTKRLLSRNNNNYPSPSRTKSTETKPGMPGMPVLPPKNQHRRSQSHAEALNQRSRSQSDAEGETAVRGGKFFQSVFSRKEDPSNLDASQSSRRKHKSMDSRMDELDGTLRKGVEKTLPPHVKSHLSAPILQRPPDMNMHHPLPSPPETSETEDVGLDLLLASASVNAPSHYQMHHLRQPHLSSSSSPSYLGRRSISAPMTCLQEDVDPNLDARRYHSQQLQLPQPATMALQRQFQPPQQQRHGGQLGLLGAQMEGGEQQRSLPPKGCLDQVLHDSNPKKNSTSSSLPPKHPHGPINPEMRKTFTEFHNAAKFDATSPFLGDDPSHSLRHDSYVSYHSVMQSGGAAGYSVPQHGTCVHQLYIRLARVDAHLLIRMLCCIYSLYSHFGTSFDCSLQCQYFATVCNC
jgi:hypothetical protein